MDAPTQPDFPENLETQHLSPPGDDDGNDAEVGGDETAIVPPSGPLYSCPEDTVPPLQQPTPEKTTGTQEIQLEAPSPAQPTTQSSSEGSLSLCLAQPPNVSAENETQASDSQSTVSFPTPPKKPVLQSGIQQTSQDASASSHKMFSSMASPSPLRLTSSSSGGRSGPPETPLADHQRTPLPSSTCPNSDGETGEKSPENSKELFFSETSGDNDSEDSFRTTREETEDDTHSVTPAVAFLPPQPSSSKTKRRNLAESKTTAGLEKKIEGD
eukprot:Rmarinus@m.17136